MDYTFNEGYMYRYPSTRNSQPAQAFAPSGGAFPGFGKAMEKRHDKSYQFNLTHLSRTETILAFGFWFSTIICEYESLILGVVFFDYR